MQLFRMTYNRKGTAGESHMTLCKTGIVGATELAMRLADSWHLADWSLQKVPFAKHTRRTYGL